MSYIFAYILTLLAFLIIDFTWLGFIAKDFYNKELGSMLRENYKWGFAFGFYFLYVFGVLFLCVLPNQEDLVKVIINSAILGLVAYGTYDLTNYTVMKDWPLKVTIVDLIWGMVVTTLTGISGYYSLKVVG